MSGSAALIDYDRDGWPDIYFTNAQSVDMALEGKKARSALYHNNHDATFTDVTDKAGVGYPCWAMGAVVGDYNNDGWRNVASSPPYLSVTAGHARTGARCGNGTNHHRGHLPIFGLPFTECMPSDAYSIPSCPWIRSRGTPLVSGTIVFTQRS